MENFILCTYVRAILNSRAPRGTTEAATGRGWVELADVVGGTTLGVGRAGVAPPSITPPTVRHCQESRQSIYLDDILIGHIASDG